MLFTALSTLCSIWRQSIKSRAKVANNFSKMLSGVVSQAKTFEMEAASFAILHNVSFDEFLAGFKVNYLSGLKDLTLTTLQKVHKKSKWGKFQTF
jgi:hypothetical protein